MVNPRHSKSAQDYRGKVVSGAAAKTMQEITTYRRKLNTQMAALEESVEKMRSNARQVNLSIVPPEKRAEMRQRMIGRLQNEMREHVTTIRSSKKPVVSSGASLTKKSKKTRVKL